jgi:hypothetical protein
MEILKSPLFIICTVLFVLHQVLQHVLHLYIPIVDAYLDNLSAMPIILSLLVAERRLLFKRGVGYQMSIIEIILAAVYISIISELLFPLLSSRFVFDWMDFVFFFIGAAMYYISVNRNKAALKGQVDTLK